MPVVNGKKLEPKTDKDLLKVDIRFRGVEMIVPEDLDYDGAIKALQLRKKEDESLVNISEEVDAFVMDGAVQFNRTLSEMFGWASMVPTPGFFGDSPPSMISVAIGHNKTMQVPWGNCKVPRIEGTFETSYTERDNLPIFRLSGVVKRKDERWVTQIAARMRELVREQSIYKGQAVKIKFRDNDGEPLDFSPTLAPRFLDLSEPITEPIFSKRVETQLQTSLYNPIMYTEHCIRHGIPLKRGILLEGTFGTGKTLTAHKLARICVQNGWTYIYLENAKDLDIALGMAKLYQPCVLFAEDVDATTSNRDEHMNRILNTLDGIESKGDKIMVVLTTNNINSIHKAFVRPGRIDSIVQLTPPDSDAMVRIARQYSKTVNGGAQIVGNDEDLQAAFRPLVGANAAFVREAVDFSKLAAVANNTNGDELQITPENISAAVTSMLPHVRLVNPNHGEDVESIDPSAVGADGSGPMTAGDVLSAAGSIIMQEMATNMLDQLTQPKNLVKALERGERRMRKKQRAARSGGI